MGPRSSCHAPRSAALLVSALVLALSFAPALAARAAGTSPSKIAAVAEIYKLSGFRDQVIAFPAVMAAQLESDKDNIPPRVYNILRTAATESFDPAVMDSLCLSRLQEELSETTTKATLAFLNSPTGRTVTEAERRSTTVEAVQQRIDFMKNRAPESDPARTTLLRTLDAASGGTEMYTTMTLTLRYAMAAAFNATRPEAERQSEDALWTLVQQDLAQIRSDSEQEALNEYSFMYRAITKEELRQYIQFAVSEPGLDYSRATLKVVAEFMAKMAQGFANVSAREFMKESK